MNSLSKREKLWLGVFVVALLWGGWNYRGLVFSKKESTQPSPGNTVTRPVPLAPSPVPRGERRADSSRDTMPSVPPWDKDPFHRAWRRNGAVAKEARVPRQRPALKLSAAVVRGDPSFAVINDKVVREGDLVAGLEVLRVEKSRVVVLDDGTEVTLKL